MRITSAIGRRETEDDPAFRVKRTGFGIFLNRLYGVFAFVPGNLPIKLMAIRSHPSRQIISVL